MPKRKQTKLKQKANKKRKIEPEISITMLPDEITQMILKNIADSDLRNLAVVSKAYNALVEEEYKARAFHSTKSITHPAMKRLSYAHFFNATQSTLTDFCETVRQILTEANLIAYGNEPWYPNLDFSYRQQGKKHDFHALYQKDPDDEEDNLFFAHQIYSTMLTKAIDLLGDFYHKKYDALKILKYLVKDMKKHAIDINHQGPFGQSLLQLICSVYSKQFFNDDCILFLINEGARITLKDDYGICAYEVLFQQIGKLKHEIIADAINRNIHTVLHLGISLKLFKLFFENVTNKASFIELLFEYIDWTQIGGKGKGSARMYFYSVDEECVNYLSNYPEANIKDQFLKLAKQHHLTLMPYSQENLGSQNKL